MSRLHAGGGSHRRAGFTIVELLVALTLSGVILVGVLGVLSAETKRLSAERAMSDTWYTLRSAAAAIAWDLRQAAGGNGSIEAITDSSLVVRSQNATGVVCAKSASGYALREVNGVFTAGTGDSVQILIAAEVPSWRYLRLLAVGTPGTVGPANCATPGSPAATLGVRLLANAPTDTSDILIGVPFMGYRRTLYGITTYDGQRWLGRRVADANAWELLTGPLRADGLRFDYYTSAGATTTVPLDVAAVRITFRAQSFGRTLSHENMQDTLTLRVYLRN